MTALVDNFDGGRIGPGCALVDPGAEEADLLCGQALTFFRHHLFGIDAGDKLNEQALGALAGEDGGTELTAFQGDGFGIESKFGFLFAGTVAAVATVGEDRLNLFNEVNLPGSRWRQFRSQTRSLHPLKKCKTEGYPHRALNWRSIV